jgi:hypothetical protein
LEVLNRISTNNPTTGRKRHAFDPALAYRGSDSDYYSDCPVHAPLTRLTASANGASSLLVRWVFMLNHLDKPSNDPIDEVEAELQ